jgi:hypothetical protein
VVDREWSRSQTFTLPARAAEPDEPSNDPGSRAATRPLAPQRRRLC